MTADIDQTLSIAVAQLDPAVGDIAGNLALARTARREAAAKGADLVLFSELFISGFPPEDLVSNPDFLTACLAALQELAADTADGGPGIVIGFPRQGEKGTYNSVAVLDGGAILALRDKVDLLFGDEWDERRHFLAGAMAGPVGFRGLRLGIAIGQDIWGELGVCETLWESGAELLVVPSASRYHRDRLDIRHQVVLRQVIETGLPLVYAAQMGGQDELVFDGGSFAFNADRTLAFQMPQFESGLVVARWQRSGESWRCMDGVIEPIPEREEADYRACLLGLRDYVSRNGFGSVLLELSGDADSALCAAMAVDALGSHSVRTVALADRSTSPALLEHAAALGTRLGCRHEVVEIATVLDALAAAIGQPRGSGSSDEADGNLRNQARTAVLSALCGSRSAMLVASGNKSDILVGCSGYGGNIERSFNPIKDLYKTQVHALAAWRNRHLPAGALGPEGEVIPAAILSEQPAPDLRLDWTDGQSMPPYPVLDDILQSLVERGMAAADIVARGHDPAIVRHVQSRLFGTEYGRRQAVPGPRIGKTYPGLRYPITNHFIDR